MSSIFGFYFVVGLLGQMGWPKRRGLFNSEAVIDSLVLDSAIDQLIDWSASMGACRPKLAMQIIATMFRENDWSSKDSFNILKVIPDLEKNWVERGNASPRDIVKPMKFSKINSVTSSKDLKDKDTQFLLEQYVFESLIWGLVNPDSFKSYYETNSNRQTERLPQYEKAGLDIDSIPNLTQFLQSGEEVLRNYEKEIRPLLPIPPELMKDVLSLGIEVSTH